MKENEPSPVSPRSVKRDEKSSYINNTHGDKVGLTVGLSVGERAVIV